MKEGMTIVDTMFTSMAGDFKAATEVVTGPAVEIWNRLAEERRMAKRQVVRAILRPRRRYV